MDGARSGWVYETICSPWRVGLIQRKERLYFKIDIQGEGVYKINGKLFAVRLNNGRR